MHPYERGEGVRHGRRPPTPFTEEEIKIEDVSIEEYDTRETKTLIMEFVISAVTVGRHHLLGYLVFSLSKYFSYWHPISPMCYGICCSLTCDHIVHSHALCDHESL